MRNRLLASALLAFAVAAPLRAVEAPPSDPAAGAAAVRQLASELTYQQGDIVLRGGVAKIKLPPGFRYLDPTNTETVLTKIWGNPRGSDTLGLIAPPDFDPLGNDSWAIVLTYNEDGYVKDDDAAKIDYNSLLQDMKKGVAAASQQRAKDGYPPIELVGWAATPRYDAATHKMYWAKEIKFGDSPSHTLNYNIRMLGRRGVLVVNAVASMSQLKAIEAATPDLLRMVDFQDGHRYADFTEKSDKVATYGLAALVAGGIGAKVGLFKGLWLALLAFKKLIVFGVIAIAGFVKKFFARKNESAGLRVDPSSPPPPPTA